MRSMQVMQSMQVMRSMQAGDAIHEGDGVDDVDGIDAVAKIDAGDVVVAIVTGFTAWLSVTNERVVPSKYRGVRLMMSAMQLSMTCE